MPSRRALAVVSTTALASLLLALPASFAAAEDSPAVKTLVVGIDGASFDFLDDADMPNLDALMARGMVSASNLYASPMAGTNSGPAWSTIATGVWPDKHNVVDNNFTAPRFDAYPDYLTRIEAAQPERSTAAVVTWRPVIDRIFGAAVDSRVAGGNDAGTTTAAVAAIDGGVDDLFVHLDEVDGAGHGGGTSGAAYLPALAKADRELGQILAAVDARPEGEEWLVMVTADHGHTPTGGHGGSSPAERKVFVVAAGAGIEPGVRHDVKIADIAPTVLGAVGIAQDPAWNLDGTAVQDLEADEFDALRPALRTRVDETRPGADVLGWTKTAPDGWSIDNSRMPAGGVTEWAGWSFATDEFWTNVELGQRRETSVRARDVFAVADSDEWDDKAHGAGPFDSTLVSPAYALTGAATATLAYATNYYIDGPQSAEVSVSFDGGAPVSLKSYTSNTNANERLSFDVPAGAQTAQFRFRYTGVNSAFWVVDRVALEQADAPAAAVSFETTASTRCTGNRLVLAVTARNTDTVAANIAITTAYGAYTASVAPGKSVFHAFTTRAAAVPAGEATVTATATIDGQQVSTTSAAPYDARSCR